MGGQAVLEGVMMRGEREYAIAVRDPEGVIRVEVRPVPGWADRWRDIPVMRGVMGLGESLGLGFRALTWSANQQVPEEEQIPDKFLGVTVAMSAAFFSAIFIVLPALAGHFLGGWLDGSFPVIESIFRLVLFLGYLVLVARLEEIRRVFQYHGAEHKAIAAYENDVEVTAESAQRFSTEHVRRGTNFLLTVMVVTIFVYSFVGRPSLPWLIASRIVLIPVVAGISYEVIRFAAGHMRWRWVRWAMIPGLGLQRITTRQPSLDQVEVAVASLLAVLTAEERAEVAARATRPGIVGRPAFGT